MAIGKAPHRELNYSEQRVRDWITSKRGILTEIALEAGVTPQFVQQIVYGRDLAVHSPTRARIERLAKDRGWPGLGRKR